MVTSTYVRNHIDAEGRQVDRTSPDSVGKWSPYQRSNSLDDQIRRDCEIYLLDGNFEVLQSSARNTFLVAV